MSGLLNKPNLSKPVFEMNALAAERVKRNACSTCGGDIVENDFKDELSRKEYSISGMCQSCQDSVFG